MLKLKKQRKEQPTSNHNRKLTYPVGVVQGTFCQKQLPSPQELANLLCLCNCYIAFGYSYILQASEWSSNTINDILFQANNLLQASIDKTQTNLITSKNIIKTFNIQTHLIEIDTSEPEVIGSLAKVSTANASTVYNGLRVFFRRKRRVCLFQCQTIYLLIWKEDEIFYVFDSHGRTDQCDTDRNDGCATLMCLASLPNVTCLIENLSELNENECYMLTELKVKKLHSQGLIQAEPKHTKFTVLDEHSAVCNGTLTAFDPCFKSTRNLQALTTCCVAYVYSLIHPPNSWTSLVIDKVMLLGNQLYQECTGFVVPEEFSVTDLPPHINIGPYSASVQVAPCQNRGRLYHNLDADPMQSELMREIRSVFVRYECALLQVETLVFCIWKRDGMFFLFDTYSRRRAVRPGKREIGAAACLQMHSTLDSLCFVLWGILMNVAEKETFHLHGLTSNIVEPTGEWNGTSSFKKKGPMNESVDELFVPKMKCRTMLPGRRKTIYDICNLDSPTVSATQFIRSWQSVKEDLDQNDSGEDSESTIFDEEDDDADDDDRPESPNNFLGLPNEDYTRLTGLGLTDDDILSFQRLALPLSEIIEWNANKCTPQDVERLLALGISLEEFKKLKKQKLTIEDLEQMKELDIPVTEYLKLKRKGLTQEQIRADIMGQSMIEEYKKLGLNAHEIRELQRIGVSAEDYAKYKEMGLTFEEIQYAHKLEISPTAYADMKSKNMSNLDIAKAKEQNLTPEEYMARKEKEANAAPEKELTSKTPTDEEQIENKNSKIDSKNSDKDEVIEVPETKNSQENIAQKPETESNKNIIPEAINIQKEIEKTTTDTKMQDSDAKDTSSGVDKTNKIASEVSKPKSTVVNELQSSEVNKIIENSHEVNKPKSTVPNELQSSEANKTNENASEVSKPKSSNDVPQSIPYDPMTADRENTFSKEYLFPEEPPKITETHQTEAESAVVSVEASLIETISSQSITEVNSAPTHIISEQSVAIVEHENAIQSRVVTRPKDSKTLEAIEAVRSPIGAVKHNLGVIKSATGKATSLLKLLANAFKMVDRVLIMNNFGGADCLAFRSIEDPPIYYLLDGCVCNKELIRRVDVKQIGHLLKRFKTLEALVDRVVKISPGPPNEREEVDNRLETVVEELSKLLDNLYVLKTKQN